MDTTNQSHCDLGEENLDFILGMVDYCGVDEYDNKDNDILMTMDDEGDDDVFENVLINNPCNHCHNNKACNRPNCSGNVFSISTPSITTTANSMENNFLTPNNENKENNDIPLPVDRNNNNNVNNNLFLNNHQHNIACSGTVSSSCAFNDEDINDHKVYHNLQNSRVVGVSLNNNNNIDWSNFGDFNLSESSSLLPDNGNNYCCHKQNIQHVNNNDSNNDNNDNNNNANPSFHWYQRNSSSSNSSSVHVNRSCSSTSRNTSTSSSIGSNMSVCGSNMGSNNSICSSNNGSLGSNNSICSINNSIHDASGSSSSRNSSCSSYSGAFATATVTSTSTTNNGYDSRCNNSNNNNNSSLNCNSGCTSNNNNNNTSSSSSNDDPSSCSGQSNSSKEVMMTAYMEACRSGQLTPILKEELKFFIQARRLSQGKDEMEVQFTPPSPSQLSAKEMEKIERRKKQNRQAAKRFRQKQKSCEDLLLQKIKDLEGVNASLFEEARVLKGEKQKLMEVIAEHLLVCPFFSLKSPVLQEGELNGLE